MEFTRVNGTPQRARQVAGRVPNPGASFNDGLDREHARNFPKDLLADSLAIKPHTVSGFIPGILD
jgi:hypothetical protein